MVTGGARPRGRGDLPVRVPQPLPPARVQRRPASRATTCSAGDGVVTFLDFGLVKRYDARRGRAVRGADPHDGARARHRAVPRDARSALRSSGTDAPFGDDDVREYFGHFYEFVMDDEVVTMSPEYASETVRRFFDSLESARARRQGRERAARVRDHPTHQPRPARGARAPARDRELPARSPRSCGRSSTGRRRRRWAKPKPPGSRPGRRFEPRGGAHLGATCAQAERKRSRIPGSSNSPGTVSGPANAPNMTGTS